ncbi:MAG: GlsB/YeaQ/YmgE family stress response membrane protein [Candidatus Dormiibacterota bacterium]
MLGVVIALDPSQLLVWVGIGLVAGLVASRVMLGHGLGLVGDILIGLVGAMAGGLLAQVFGVSFTVPGYPLISDAIIAFLGAVILLAIFRLFGAGKRRTLIRR